MDTNKLTRSTNEMQEQLENEAQDVKEHIREASENWRRRATQAARNAGITADQYVHDYAWTSIGLAAVVGCVVGFFLGRRRD